ncbi:Gram-negative bacterial tonB protein [Bernardetia litoralis DSM 6794]|uniref:Gram-negative bacterial tonB protein n=1 Tax=Bernardetia litoralis (strain ATCC 23117 / DSM 6794 / NBRC 15988 / NCIMB 1366 / Fx l1 / Sio-4) TaxID=880071 RepID=I4ANC6_BERLS|nr:energy transducer TonB [Bernardetia litoralis]AFM05461.1 Gram-negative bacterial tonB protein [Bernardetia litoralis DSM 6794]
MAMLIVFTIFGLFWLGTTLASITYMVFKNSRNLTQTLENHPPFWLQDYYAFLNRYHKPLLIGSITMGIGLTIWGINSQNKTTCDWQKPSYRNETIQRKHCNKGATRKRSYVEHSAIPYGGTENLYRYFEQNKQNPTGETGTIYVQFFIQEDGSLADISVLSSVSPTLDNEAIRLIEEYTEGWQPALYHGRAVEQRVVIPVQF